MYSNAFLKGNRVCGMQARQAGLRRREVGWDNTASCPTWTSRTRDKCSLVLQRIWPSPSLLTVNFAQLNREAVTASDDVVQACGQTAREGGGARSSHKQAATNTNGVRTRINRVLDASQFSSCFINEFLICSFEMAHRSRELRQMHQAVPAVVDEPRQELQVIHVCSV